MSMSTSFPAKPDAQVTLANWRQPPYHRWGFQHVREIVPSADIPAATDRAWKLPVAAQDLGAMPVDTANGRRMALNDVLAATATDAFVVVHRGRVITERYDNAMTAETPHILMSVSKSMLGLLAGILADDGALTIDGRAIELVPELRGSAFEEVSIRQLLDMRTALDFDEDYTTTTGPIIAYRKATNWNPLAPGETATDLRAFLPTLASLSGPHGGRFNYTSPCTDLLGWVIERAVGRPYAEIMSEKLWRPLGAAHSAYVTVDRLGAPRCAGGMCTTAMDLARVGQLLVEGGTRDGRQVVPESWLADIATAGDPAAWDAGSFLPYYPGRSMHYRSKWYVERGDNPLLFGMGIHGQNLFVDRSMELVIAKFSSQDAPLDTEAIALTSSAVDAIRRELAG